MCRISTVANSQYQNSSKKNSSAEVPTEEPVFIIRVETVPVTVLYHCYLPNRAFYRPFGKIFRSVKLWFIRVKNLPTWSRHWRILHLTGPTTLSELHQLHTQYTQYTYKQHGWILPQRMLLTPVNPTWYSIYNPLTITRDPDKLLKF